MIKDLLIFSEKIVMIGLLFTRKSRVIQREACYINREETRRN